MRINRFLVQQGWRCGHARNSLPVEIGGHSPWQAHLGSVHSPKVSKAIRKKRLRPQQQVNASQEVPSGDSPLLSGQDIAKTLRETASIPPRRSERLRQNLAQLKARPEFLPQMYSKLQPDQGRRGKLQVIRYPRSQRNLMGYPRNSSQRQHGERREMDSN